MSNLINHATCQPCLLGAVALASGVDEQFLLYDDSKYDVFNLGGEAYWPALALAYQLAPVDISHPESPPAYDDVYVFNDSTGNDEEVYALIDRAIEAEG